MKITLFAMAIFALSAISNIAAAEVWTTCTFEDFRKGSFGNGGQNIYVSANGTLQRIHHSDINLDGEVDLSPKVPKVALIAMQRAHAKMYAAR